MNNKGQALVEFILILPVFLMILFVIVDFGNIFTNKAKLSSVSDDVIDMYKNGDNIQEINKVYNDVKITTSKYKDKYIRLKLEKSVDLITPGLNRIMSDPFVIDIERVINVS